MLRTLPLYDEEAMEDTTIFVSIKDLKTLPTPMTHSSIDHGVKNLWQKVHGKESKVSATKLRKSVVTNVRKENPLAREPLATHMCHRPTTADRYYDLHCRHAIAIPMSKMITKAMTTEVYICHCI